MMTVSPVVTATPVLCQSSSARTLTTTIMLDAPCTELWTWARIAVAPCGWVEDVPWSELCDRVEVEEDEEDEFCDCAGNEDELCDDAEYPLGAAGGLEVRAIRMPTAVTPPTMGSIILG